MTQQSYQHCSELEIEVGNWIFVRLQQYKQISLDKKKKKESKLAPRYYGPYKVSQNN